MTTPRILSPFLSSVTRFQTRFITNYVFKVKGGTIGSHKEEVVRERKKKLTPFFFFLSFFIVPTSLFKEVYSKFFRRRRRTNSVKSYM